MTDTYDSNGQLVQADAPTPEMTANDLTASLAAPADVATPPAPIAEAASAPVNTDVLKQFLTFLGHDVEECWEEVVSLARKAKKAV